MCGFFITNNKLSFDKYKSNKNLTSKIFTRGPDEQEFLIDDEHQFYTHFARLSLSGDFENGKQPILIKAHKQHKLICFNGEIFNFRGLSKKYNLKMVSGDGDTAFLKKILTYNKLEEVVHLFEGMFSIVELDLVNGVYTGVKDYFGKLPLNYYFNQKDNVFCFSSSATCVAHSTQNTELNFEVFKSYLFFGMSNISDTIYKNIKSVGGGEMIKISGANIERSFPFTTRMSENDGETLHIDLADAIDRRLETTRGVAMFHSFGIDSTIVSEICSKKSLLIENYTAVFNETSRSEWGHSNYIFVSEDNYFDHLEKVMGYSDDVCVDPVTPVLSILGSALNNKQKIVMTGDGADELVGGYKWYSRYQKILLLRKIIKLFSFEFLVKHIKNERIVEVLTCDPAYVAFFLRSPVRKRVLDSLNCFPPVNSEFYSKVGNMREFDLEIFLQATMLKKNDIAAAVNGIEIRSPFLDETFFRHHFQKKNGKKVLKKLYKKLTHRNAPDKEGFELPFGNWNIHEKIDLMEFEEVFLYFFPNEVDFIKRLRATEIDKIKDKYFLLNLMQSHCWMLSQMKSRGVVRDVD